MLYEILKQKLQKNYRNYDYKNNVPDCGFYSFGN